MKLIGTTTFTKPDSTEETIETTKVLVGIPDKQLVQNTLHQLVGNMVNDIAMQTGANFKSLSVTIEA